MTGSASSMSPKSRRRRLVPEILPRSRPERQTSIPAWAGRWNGIPLPGHAVVEAAGGRVLTEDGTPLLYGKTERGYDNPHFIVYGDVTPA